MNKTHPRWAIRLRWWLWDEGPLWLTGPLQEPGQRILCALFGHAPDRDMCMNPEHDFCALCMKSMPYTAAGSVFPKLRLFRWLP